MIEKTVLSPKRIRRISGSFAFIEHRFLSDGFFQSLSHHELLLYLFLVLASDRYGLSYYRYDKICTLLKISLDDYLLARDTLIEKDLIAFDGTLYQVLSLPQSARRASGSPLKTKEDFLKHDPATIRQLIRKSIGANHD
jgi:hypothetical protein